MNPSWKAKDNPVHKQNFRGRVILQRETTFNMRLHSNGQETFKELTRVAGLTLSGGFIRENVNPLARVALASLYTRRRKKKRKCTSARVTHLLG